MSEIQVNFEGQILPLDSFLGGNGEVIYIQSHQLYIVVKVMGSQYMWASIVKPPGYMYQGYTVNLSNLQELNGFFKAKGIPYMDNERNALENSILQVVTGIIDGIMQIPGMEHLLHGERLKNAQNTRQSGGQIYGVTVYRGQRMR